MLAMASPTTKVLVPVSGWGTESWSSVSRLLHRRCITEQRVKAPNASDNPAALFASLLTMDLSCISFLGFSIE